MKRYKLIAMAVLMSALGTAATWAQEKGISIPTRWYISSGPGAGTILDGNPFGIISDPDWDAFGHVALPDECDCVHYHGVLFDKDDPNPNGCGWGCIIELPVNPIVALGDLLNAIDQVALIDPALATKLDDILETAASSASNRCNTLFLSTLSAMGDEVNAVLSGQPTILEPYADVVEAMMHYCALALENMDLPPPVVTNEPPCCSVMLLRRHGSAAASKLFDAKRKINAEVGEVIALDAKSCPEGGPFQWEYKFKGEAKGEVPRGSGVGFTNNRFCVLSERPTTVTVTVSFLCPNGKEVRDTVTINIQ